MVGLVLLERGFIPPPPTPQSLLYTMALCVFITMALCVFIHRLLIRSPPPFPPITHTGLPTYSLVQNQHFVNYMVALYNDWISNLSGKESFIKGGFLSCYWMPWIMILYTKIIQYILLKCEHKKNDKNKMSVLFLCQGLMKFTDFCTRRLWATECFKC